MVLLFFGTVLLFLLLCDKRGCADVQRTLKPSPTLLLETYNFLVPHAKHVTNDKFYRSSITILMISSFFQSSIASPW